MHAKALVLNHSLDSMCKISFFYRALLSQDIRTENEPRQLPSGVTLEIYTRSVSSILFNFYDDVASNTATHVEHRFCLL